MRSQRYSSEGIILSRGNYSETDRILSVYTKDYGKLFFIAKGIRKLKSKKRGSLEVFSQVKFSASRGKGLDILTEVETIRHFSVARGDLKKVSVAYFFVEAVNKLTREEEKNRDYYFLIVRFLRLLEVAGSLKTLRKTFIYESLVLLGFWPKGKLLGEADQVLENVVEREMTSVRVGKKVLGIR